MPFAWYARLGPKERRIYDASAKVRAVPLPTAERLRSHVAALEAALARGERGAVEDASAKLACGICDQLAVARVVVKVKAKRPKSEGSELHGLFEHEDGHAPVLTLWMRTAERKQVVSFRTFLRTLLHEVLHHLDYAHFGFADSLHTEGFYARESSLLSQLVAPAPKKERAPRAEREPRAPKPVQLGLFE